MANTLQDAKVVTALERMYTEAKNQMSLLRDMHDQLQRPMTAQERAEAMSEFYIPVTPEAGLLLYALV
ncbi:MAG: methyltransferase, partial [Mycobacterium sp.]